MREWSLLVVGLVAACSKGEAPAPGAGAPGSLEAASAWPAVSTPPLSEDPALDGARQHGAYKATADRRLRMLDARIDQVVPLAQAGKLAPGKLAEIRETRQQIDRAFHEVEGATDAAWPVATAHFEDADKKLTQLLDAALAPPTR